MNKIVIFSGAGLSAESGLSTFRDNDGLWEKYDLNVVCNFITWEQNFNLVHQFYNERRKQLKNVEPNEAHKIIAKIQNEFDNVILITQNVDDLLERAGCKDVIHVHGKLDEVYCPICKWEIKMNYEEFDYENTVCPDCNNIKLKPKVIFFMESAPEYHWMYRHLERLEKEDIIIVVGTDGSVVKIDNILNERYNGIENGVKCTKVLLNLNESDSINSNNFHWVFMEKATTGMAKIYNLLKKKYPSKNNGIGSDFNSFLKEEGILEKVESEAIKKVEEYKENENKNSSHRNVIYD
jgi:NAD-dependent deacetylase